MSPLCYKYNSNRFNKTIVPRPLTSDHLVRTSDLSCPLNGVEDSQAYCTRDADIVCIYVCVCVCIY